MSDPISGWLNLEQAPKDTTYGSNTKWDTLAKANDIKKLNTLIDLPDFEVDVTGHPYLQYCRFAQYNYDAGKVFTILGMYRSGVLYKFPFDFTFLYPQNNILLDHYPSFGAWIRYRVGTVVTRYQLVPSDIMSQPVIYPPYKGQIIKGKFSIEFFRWLPYPIGGFNNIYKLAQQVKLVTSIQNTPINYNDTSPLISPIGDSPVTNLQLPLGNPLPYLFPSNGPFESN